MLMYLLGAHIDKFYLQRLTIWIRSCLRINEVFCVNIAHCATMDDISSYIEQELSLVFGTAVFAKNARVYLYSATSAPVHRIVIDDIFLFKSMTTAFVIRIVNIYGTEEIVHAAFYIDIRYDKIFVFEQIEPGLYASVESVAAIIDGNDGTNTW